MNDNGLGVMTRMMSLAAAPSGAPVARQYPAPAWSCDPGQWNVADIIQSPERFYPSRVPELLPRFLAEEEVHKPFEHCD